MSRQKDEPLVSVLIPCFNAEKYVERAVASILNQTYENLEIWLINDASTDKTLQVLQTFTDSRIRIVDFETNTKKIGAVNDVLEKVNGNFIAFQDADDWSERTRISNQVAAFMADESLGLCLTGYQYFEKSNYTPQNLAITPEELEYAFKHFYSAEAVKELPACATMMIRRDVYAVIGGYHPFFKGRVAEDIYWLYRIIKKFKAKTINEILYHYRAHDTSLTGIQFSGGNVKAIYAWELLANIIAEEEKEGIDVLAQFSKAQLNELELRSCEQKLVKLSKQLIQQDIEFANSISYKIGRIITRPFTWLKNRL